jgi:hypothetical protein
MINKYPYKSRVHLARGLHIHIDMNNGTRKKATNIQNNPLHCQAKEYNRDMTNKQTKGDNMTTQEDTRFKVINKASRLWKAGLISKEERDSLIIHAEVETDFAETSYEDLVHQCQERILDRG